MKYIKVSDPNKVGTFPALCYAGGGYFFDEVLEYRVWFRKNDGINYFIPCDSFEVAEELGKNPNVYNIHDYAQKPLALVIQREWVNNLGNGIYEHKRGERLTEWQVDWLIKGVRKPGDIENFLASLKDN